MDEKAVQHFHKVDPTLGHIAERVLESLGPFTMQVAADYYAALCDHIVSQQLSIRVADVILKRFTALFPGNFITPEGTLALSDEQLRAVGFSRAKVGYIKDLAQQVVDGRVELAKFSDLDDETIKSELIRVKGIGPWTAEMFLIFNLNRPDVFSPGDLGLKNAIKKWYSLENPKEKDLIALAEPWSPYRSYACRILWKSLSLE